MQAGACGVKRHSDTVLEQGNLNIVQGAAFFKMLDPVAFPQLLDDGFLRDGLTRRHARKLRLDGRSVDDKFSFGRNPFLPGDGLDLLKQVFKFQGFKFRHFDLHTVCRPQPQVRARHRAFITHKGNLAVFRAKNFIAERLDLAFRDGFQPKGRCRDNF